jgi:recombination protein RecT
VSTDLTTQEPQPQTPGEKQKARLDRFMSELESRNDTIETLLSDSGVDPKVFLAVARRALQNNPDILNCTAASILKAFIDAATDGLLPDGRLAAIVVYRRKGGGSDAQYQPMYQGLLSLAYQSGNFKSIESRVVYEGDFFEYELGDDPKIRHKPASRPAGSAPEIIAAYAVAKTVNGGIFREVFEGEDIRKVKAVSKAVNGPARQWSEEMARKGPLRRLWKFIPRDKAMDRIAEHDNANYDLGALDITPEPERKLRPGFAPVVPPEPAQLTQDSTLPMDMVQDDEREAVEAEFEDAGQEERPQAKAAPEPNDMAEVPIEPERAQDEAPELPDTFLLNLRNAGSWLNIKQALRTIFKDERVRPIAGHLRAAAWRRFQELHAEGSERTDFVNDPVLFRCWIDGENPGAEDLGRNYALLQKDSAYLKLAEEEKDRIAQHVEEARG